MLTTYLGPYGYQAESPQRWEAVPSACVRKPTLQIQIAGHTKKGMSTLYKLQCELKAVAPALSVDWEVERQLVTLRAGLHDVVKHELGKRYGDHFSDVPFAQRGGPKGTTERLQSWLARLSTRTNNGASPPTLVAQTLLFLDAPPQPSHVTTAEKMEAPSHIGTDEPTQGTSGRDEQVVCVPETETARSDASGGSLGDSAPIQSVTPRKRMSTDTAGVSVECDAPMPSHTIEPARQRSRTPQRTPRAEPLASEPVQDLIITEAKKPVQSEKGAALSPDPVKRLLELFGYEVCSADTWAVSPARQGPQVELAVETHEKSSGGTLYTLSCRISSRRQERAQWRVKRTLAELREGMHEVVKNHLARSYSDVFYDAPFAMRHGPPGTTGRLQAWMERLTARMNEGVDPPALLAKILEFLDIPKDGVSTDEHHAEVTDTSANENTLDPKVIDNGKNAKMSSPSTVIKIGSLKKMSRERDHSPSLAKWKEDADLAKLAYTEPSTDLNDAQSASESDTPSDHEFCSRASVTVKIHKWFAKLKVTLQHKLEGLTV